MIHQHKRSLQRTSTLFDMNRHIVTYAFDMAKLNQSFSRSKGVYEMLSVLEED